MKNYLKLLSMFIMFVLITFSCNEKSTLQTGEFEYNLENVLEGNSILLQNVNTIINEYDEDGYILRMAVIESNTCDEIKHDFMSLNSAEQAMVWKDRVISDLKSKEFNEMQYKFLTEAYSTITTESYEPGSDANLYARNRVEVLWNKLKTEDPTYKKLLPTLLKLHDDEMTCGSTDKEVIPPLHVKLLL